MKKFLMILVGISAFIVGLYWITSDGATIRYRMTLTATVDGQPMTGSGVIEVRYLHEPRWLPVDTQQEIVQVDGEAIVLDLKDRGKLFALLQPVLINEKGLYIRWLIPSVWRHHGLSTAKDSDQYYSWLRGLNGKVVLEPSELPVLAHFRDLGDPSTLVVVSPDDMAASFGPGVKLTDVTVEITNDKVTRGIINTLPWLANMKSGDPHRTADKEAFISSPGK